MLIIRFVKSLGLCDPKKLSESCAWLLPFSKSRSIVRSITGASRVSGNFTAGARGADDVGEQSLTPNATVDRLRQQH